MKGAPHVSLILRQLPSHSTRDGVWLDKDRLLGRTLGSLPLTQRRDDEKPIGQRQGHVSLKKCLEKRGSRIFGFQHGTCRFLPSLDASLVEVTARWHPVTLASFWLGSPNDSSTALAPGSLSVSREPPVNESQRPSRLYRCQSLRLEEIHNFVRSIPCV